MDSLKCHESETIEKDDLHCTLCQRIYSLYMIHHTCNMLARCSTPSVYYTEKYKKYNDNRVRVFVQIICDECKEKAKKKSILKVSTCPKCNYTGYYKHSGNKICLACSAQNTEPKPIHESVEPEPIREVVEPKLEPKLEPKPAIRYLILYYNLSITGLHPQTGECTRIEIIGADERSFSSEQWAVVEFSADMSEETMKLLSEFIQKTKMSYEITWDKTSAIQWNWLKYLCKKYNVNI